MGQSTTSQRLDELKSTIQDVDEKQESCENRLTKRFDSTTERVDKFSLLLDTFSSSTITNKMTSVGNREKIEFITVSWKKLKPTNPLPKNNWIPQQLQLKTAATELKPSPPISMMSQPSSVTLSRR